MSRWFLLPLVVLGVLLSSMGATEAPSWTGKVAVKGNEPFTFLALTDDDGREWRLTGDLAKELRATAQGHRVRITGKLQEKNTIRSTIVVETWTWVDKTE